MVVYQDSWLNCTHIVLVSPREAEEARRIINKDKIIITEVTHQSTSNLTYVVFSLLWILGSTGIGQQLVPGREAKDFF